MRIARLPPRGFGIAASVLLLAATLGYGAVAGGHVAEIVDWLKDARDQAANAAGFRIAAISLTGPKEVSREEVLTIAGVTGHASLLFLDADAARARLMANPWIADAAVLKLYPDRLQITVTERQAFALWQKDGTVSVIADDGTVLEPFVEDRYRGLPLWSARAPSARPGFPRRRRPLSRHPRDAARFGLRRRAALEPAAQRRHRRAPAGKRRRARARPAGMRSIARKSFCRATSSPSICGCRIA